MVVLKGGDNSKVGPATFMAVANSSRTEPIVTQFMGVNGGVSVYLLEKVLPILTIAFTNTSAFNPYLVKQALFCFLLTKWDQIANSMPIGLSWNYYQQLKRVKDFTH